MLAAEISRPEYLELDARYTVSGNFALRRYKEYAYRAIWFRFINPTNSILCISAVLSHLVAASDQLSCCITDRHVAPAQQC